MDYWTHKPEMASAHEVKQALSADAMVMLEGAFIPVEDLEIDGDDMFVKTYKMLETPEEVLGWAVEYAYVGPVVCRITIPV